MHWMILPYRRYFEFSGRSRRKEYWLFTLFTMLVTLVLMATAVALVASNLQGVMEWTPAAWQRLSVGVWAVGGLLVLFFLFSIIPAVAVQIRRLHDLGVSGWWYLAFLVGGGVIDQIPEVGQALNSLLSIGWIVWMFMPGTQGPNTYGDDPKNPVDLAVFA